MSPPDSAGRGTDRDSGLPTQSEIAQPSPAESAGMLIAGKYKLLQRIGEGGMGSVWMAGQLEPVKRRVAIKLIRTEREGSRMILSRFEAEQQAIALMDHPHIAKLLDAGTTKSEAGGLHLSERPFFVMELVKGVPLTEFCDEHKLSIPDRLNLFMQVCGAVQHAHQKGIIHRDLKPTNILVEMHDDKPVPKVIDFGLAKAMSGQPLTEHTLFTAFGTIAGTPLYMAPEQAKFNAIDIDTRADIYALGVILYELLTGSTPIERATLKKAALDEIMRLIRESEPPAPSKRISTTASKPSVAANRHTEPAKLGRFVKGELDWIVMKALAKERDRRYETANGFAKDIEHFLNHEPVHAGPPSLNYRLRKFIQRNRAQVIAASVVIIALLAGIAGITIGLIRAEQHRQLAEANERKATHAAAAERQARQQAEHAEHLAKANESRAQAERDVATQAKQQLQTEHTRSEWRLYASQIALAQREWEDADVGHARDVLDSCRPDFRGWEYHYLRTLFDKNQRTFRGHHHAVYSIVFSPDGRRIASGSDDKTIKLWDAATGQEILTLKGHSGEVHDVAFSPDGRRIASGSEDGTIKLWDAATGQETLTLKRHRNTVSGVAFSPDGRRIASGSGETIKLWDVVTGQETLTLKGHVGGFRMAFSPDGRLIASTCGNFTIKLWDAATGQEGLTLKGHSGVVYGVAFSPDGRRIASGSDDQTIKLWDAATGQETLTLKGHDGQVISVAFSPDGRRIASGSGHDCTIKLWDTATGRETLTLKGHSSLIFSVAFSPDGRWIASGSADNTIKVWNASTGQETLTLKGHKGQVFSVAFSPDGRRIASGGDWVKLWDATTGQETLTLKGHDHRVLSVAFSPDGRRIASGSWDQTIKLWDAATGQEARTLKGHSGEVRSVAFSPDGRRIASGSADRTIKLWDAATGQEILTLKGHSEDVRSVIFSPDGKRLASGSYDKTIKLWDAVTGQETLTLKQGPDMLGVAIDQGASGHSNRVLAVAFSPDGRRIASGSRETIKLWDAVTGQETLTLKGHSGDSVAFSPDGRRIASGSGETIKLRDTVTGQETLTLKGHSGLVDNVAFSPDGRRMASGSWDATIKVWDATLQETPKEFSACQVQEFKNLADAYEEQETQWRRPGDPPRPQSSYSRTSSSIRALPRELQDSVPEQLRMDTWIATEEREKPEESGRLRVVAKRN
jgi:WD40 repeat protein/serine/threonine protein kinase